MPKSIAWKITENCNSRCRTCSHWRTHVDDELTFKECKTVINKCFENGINSFRLTGGDPSLRKDLPEIIEYIHGKHGFVSVNSNLINIENIPLEIENLFVPLDGTRGTYRELRGVDAFNKVCENLTYFTEHSEANIVVTVILMKQTINDLPNIIELCRNLKVKLHFNLIDSNPYFFRGAEPFIKESSVTDFTIKLLRLYDSQVFFVSKETLTKIPFFYDCVKEAEMTCPIVLRNVKMGSRGDVYPGCWSAEPVGNVRKKSLTEILRSESYVETVQRLFKHECSGCTCGWVQRVKAVT